MSGKRAPQPRLIPANNDLSTVDPAPNQRTRRKKKGNKKHGNTRALKGNGNAIKTGAFVAVPDDPEMLILQYAIIQDLGGQQNIPTIKLKAIKDFTFADYRTRRLEKEMQYNLHRGRSIPRWKENVWTRYVAVKLKLASLIGTARVPRDVVPTLQSIAARALQAAPTNPQPVNGKEDTEQQ